MNKIIFLVILLTWSTLSESQTIDTIKLDSLFTSIENHKRGMGSVSLFHNGKEIYQRSYGYSDIENQIKNSTNTKFRIGSISKTFTATIIMKLIEEGKLSLTSPLSDYYPQIPNANKITIEYLLQHRSGIPNFTDAEDYTSWCTKKQTKKVLLDRIISGKTSFEPNEEFEYSNSNYVLLTYIAEDISSKTFADLLDEIICMPCLLNNTYVGENISSNNKEAYSYIKQSAGWEKANETDMSVPQGSGFIVSNAYDLNRFMYCLFSEKIINKKSLKQMTSLKDNFGLGLLKVPFDDYTGYGHTGGIDGFQSNAFYFPKANLSIALVENGVGYMLNNIVVGCLSIYFGKNYDLPKFTDAINVTAEELNKYTGVYSSPDLPIKLTITKKGNSLIAQGTGQPELPLECTGSDRFQCESVDLMLEFLPEENKMVLKQLGMVLEMSRESKKD